MKDVLLTSWTNKRDGDAGFGFAHVTGWTRDAWQLVKLDKPTEHEGRVYRWIARHVEVNERGNILAVHRVGWLPVKTERAAQRLFREIAGTTGERKPAAPRAKAIQRAQVRALANRYRRTVDLWQKLETAPESEREHLRGELWQAYAEETAIACGGSPAVEPVTSAGSLKRISAGLEAARRRGRKAEAPDVAALLVIGVMVKGFDALPWAAIRTRLEIAGAKATTAAIKKTWFRLGLPSARTPGRR